MKIKIKYITFAQIDEAIFSSSSRDFVFNSEYNFFSNELFTQKFSGFPSKGFILCFFRAVNMSIKFQLLV